MLILGVDIDWIGIGVDREGEFRERQEVLGYGAGSRGSVEGPSAQ
jgi:hypothetical protein